MQLFGTSGIRKIVDANLIQLALKVGLAVGRIYSSIVVGSDTRNSSPALKHAFVSGLLAAGSRCYDAGIIPTPTLAFAARQFDVGAMITASHNPPEYNGIKLLKPNGAAFDSHQRRQIEEALEGPLAVVSWEEMKNSITYPQAIDQHIERILQDFPNELKLRVVVDCGCGAGSVITPYLLRKLGCEVIALNCYPSGFFPRNSEPTEASLSNLIKATKELDANLGIAHDGDADRMMAVDDKGRFISGDKLLVLLVQELEAREVVTTVDASMNIDEMGLKVTRAKVGDAYVSEELQKGGDFGGEPSGSWIFPTISLCPDGIYAAARMAALASQQKLSPLIDRIPRYPLLRGSVSSQKIALSGLEKRLLTMEPLSVSKVDGIKLNFEAGWLLIRASGTEPKIRVTAEAKSEAKAHQLYDSGIKTIKACIEVV